MALINAIILPARTFSPSARSPCWAAPRRNTDRASAGIRSRCVLRTDRGRSEGLRQMGRHRTSEMRTWRVHADAGVGCDVALIAARSLTALGGACVAAARAPFVSRGQVVTTRQRQYSTRAVDLVRRATVIDMLSPLTLDFPKFGRWMSDPTRLAGRPQPFRTSGINVFHIAVGTGGPNAHPQTVQFLSAWNSFLANQDQAFMRIDSAADLDRVKAIGAHRRAARSAELRALPHVRRRRSVLCGSASESRSSPTTPAT